MTEHFENGFAEERLDDSVRGPNLKLVHDEHGERRMSFAFVDEQVVTANDNEPLWAIHAAQDLGYTVGYAHPNYDPPERFADELDVVDPRDVLE